MLNNVAVLHTNTGHDCLYDPRQIRSIGFNGDRFVPQAHLLERQGNYVQRCHDAGMAVIACLAKESFENPAHGYMLTYGQAIDLYAQAFITPNASVDYWEFGNEFRGGGYESWTLTDDQVNELLLACVPAIRRYHADALVIAPSTVDGQPGSYRGVNLGLVDFLNPHFYAQTEESIDTFLDAHKEQARRTRLGKFFLTEGGWPHPDPIKRGAYIQGMTQRMDNRGDVYGVGWYNYESRQNHPEPFFVVDDGNLTGAVPFLREMRVGDADILMGPVQPGSPIDIPPETHRDGYFVGSGVRTLIDKHDLTVLGREDYFNTNCSLTPAVPRSVLWVQSAGKGYLIGMKEA